MKNREGRARWVSNSITRLSRRRTNGSRPSSSLISSISRQWGHFVPVKTANGVTLDFDTREEFRPGHYAFLVSDAEFDAAFARIRARGVRYYADPRRTKSGEINHLHGGRGVYFEDPNGHVMEIITHPYGDRPEEILSSASR